MKKWLLDQGDVVSLVKCNRYVQGAIDVVGSRLETSSPYSHPEGLLNLDGVNYVVTNGVLRAFQCGTGMKDCVVIGPRGVFEVVQDPSNTLEKVGLQSCWTAHPNLQPFAMPDCSRDHQWLVPYYTGK